MNGSMLSGRTVRNRKGKGGFTLIELLTVVAILSLLMTMLLPTLGKAKEQARIVICLTNLKGLGVAFAMYNAKSNDWMPQASGKLGDPPTWDWILRPYYDNLGMIGCPSDKQDRKAFYEIRQLERMYEEDKPRSYAINGRRSGTPRRTVSHQGWSGWGSTPGNPVRFWPGGREATIRNWHKTSDTKVPAETLLLGEQWESLYYGSTPQPGLFNDYKGNALVPGYRGKDDVSRDPTYDVHANRDRANYLFCDQRGETLMAEDPYLHEESDYYYYDRDQKSKADVDL